MNLLATYSLLHWVMAKEPQLPDLKPLISQWTGQRIRRLDRYIELCIAGGLNCVAERKLPSDTGIYLATRCGAVTTSAAVMQAIVANGESPKPLHFVNTLGNSAGFYLTQLLGVTGTAVLVSQENLSFEAALLHAFLDLHAGRVKCALVGGFDEVALSLNCHALRLEAEHVECFSEGSHWLLLDGSAPRNGIRLSCPFYAEGQEDLQAWLNRHPADRVQTSFIPTQQERSWLPASCHAFAGIPIGDGSIALHGVFSGAALTGLAEVIRETGGRGVHIARDSAERYCAVLIDAAEPDLA